MRLQQGGQMPPALPFPKCTPGRECCRCVGANSYTGLTKEERNIGVGSSTSPPEVHPKELSSEQSSLPPPCSRAHLQNGTRVITLVTRDNSCQYSCLQLKCKQNTVTVCVCVCACVRVCVCVTVETHCSW